jgi:biopolymer transport protein ExbD
MAQKPSERSRSAMEPVDLDIVPYMDIIFSLVSYILFTSTGLAEIGVINVNAPRYQDPLLAAGIEQQDQPEEKKQLNLTVGITHKGFFIAGVGGVLGGGEQGGEQKSGEAAPTIPLKTDDATCRDALARNIPPPVTCYDTAKLTSEMIKIKNEFPDETRIFIYAQPDIPYEVLVKVMDATRQYKGRNLFYDVILVPEIA